MKKVYVLMIGLLEKEDFDCKILKCYNEKHMAETERKRLRNSLGEIYSKLKKAEKCSDEYFEIMDGYFKIYPELYFGEAWDICDSIIIEEVELI